MAHDHVVTIDIDVEKEDESDISSQATTLRQTPPPLLSPTPSSDQTAQEFQPELQNAASKNYVSNKSCFVCRNTLLLSYFNCCAVCLGVIECGWQVQDEEKGGRHASGPSATTSDLFPPIAKPQPAHTAPPRPSYSPPSSPSPSLSNTNTNTNTNTTNTTRNPRKPPHCTSPYCRYTHHRALMLLFAACEAVPSLSGLALLNAALYARDWALLRFAGMLVLQWWQIFVLPRQQWRRRGDGRDGRGGVRPESVLTVLACLFVVWAYVDASRAAASGWWEPFAVSSVLLKIVFPW